MKYIRTKDGIIFENKNYVDDRVMIFIDAESKKVIYKVNNYAFGIEEHEYSIVKQADTIEELCDQLVYVEDTIPTDIYPPLMNPKGIIECQIELGCTEVYKLENFKYGIWTKNGLKYVAEFNDKGELELL